MASEGYHQRNRERHIRHGISDEGFKTCSWCRAIKSLVEFHIDRARSDGRNHQCMPCARETRRRRT